MSFEDRMEKELKARNEPAWKSYWALINVYKNKKLAIKTKMKILESCTIPVLSYGSQTWSLTKL